MSENLVLIETNEDNTVTTIKLNRLDKKNAFNLDLLNAFRDALQEISQTNTRVIIITGQENVFSAGIDLNMLTTADLSSIGIKDIKKPPNFRHFVNTFIQPIINKIEKIEKPVIARINGYCLGLAFEMALACDFRFALKSAKFSMPETKIGMNPDVGGTIRLTRIAGIANAKDIILTGRTFDGEEAYRLGVVNKFADSIEDLDKIIKNYVDELIDSAPLAVGLSKKLIDDCYGKDINFGNELETLVSSQLLQTKDFSIGAAARLQKVKPKWKGK
ncbi:MAG: enoyl-CoA hydratase/isomerase family protein [Promethearchaeota archaeon]